MEYWYAYDVAMPLLRCDLDRGNLQERSSTHGAEYDAILTWALYRIESAGHKSMLKPLTHRLGDLDLDDLKHGALFRAMIPGNT